MSALLRSAGVLPLLADQQEEVCGSAVDQP